MRIRQQMRANRHRELRAELAALRAELTAMRGELATVRANPGPAPAPSSGSAALAVTPASPAPALTEGPADGDDSALTEAPADGDDAALTEDPAAAAVTEDLAGRYVAWRSGALVRIGKALARRAGPSGEAPVRWRGSAMRVLCRVLLTPATDIPEHHRQVGDTVTELLGGAGWRNDAEFIRALIDVRDGAAPLTREVAPDRWNWPSTDAPIRTHEILPGSEGPRIVLVVAPGLGAVPPLVVAGHQPD